MRKVVLVIRQHRPPNTRFTVRFENMWAAFNTFAEVREFLHDVTIDQLPEYVDLTDDELQLDIDRQYEELTAHLR